MVRESVVSSAVRNVDVLCEEGGGADGSQALLSRSRWVSLKPPPCECCGNPRPADSAPGAGADGEGFGEAVSLGQDLFQALGRDPPHRSLSAPRGGRVTLVCSVMGCVRGAPPLLYWPCPGAAFSWVLLWFGCFFSLPWTFTADLIRTILHCFFPRYRWSCWRWRLGSAVNPPEWFSVGVICLLSKATEKSCAGGGAYLESWGTEWFLKLCFHIGVFQVVCSLGFFSCDLALFTLSATYNWVSELKWKCAFLHW